MVGEARWHVAANGQTCELAASIADTWQRQGFGTWLLNHIAARVRSMGVRYLLAEILHANKPAQRLVRKLGFHALPSNFDPKVMCFVKELEPSGRSVAAGICAFPTSKSQKKRGTKYPGCRRESAGTPGPWEFLKQASPRQRHR